MDPGEVAGGGEVTAGGVVAGGSAVRPDRFRPGPEEALLVLHVLEAVRGGTSRHVVDIVRHAVGVRHVVALSRPGGERSSGAVYDRPAVEAMRRAGAQVVEIPMHRTPWHPANAAGLTRLRRLLRSTGADVLHGHSSVGGALARLAGSTAAVPVVYTANGLAQGLPYLLVERALGHWTDKWVAVSAGEAELALRRGLARPAALAVVPNGIDLRPPPPAEDLRQRLGIPAGTPLIGTVARLVAQKAPQRFVRVAAEVAARHPDVHFLLIGMGPLQPLLDAEVGRAGLGPRWHQIRHLDDAPAALAQLDAFVLASEFEGAPYTPLEAMRAGVPVILSDVVGNRDTVRDGVSGFLRAPADTAGMAAAVLQVLTDEQLRRTVSEQATGRLIRCFDAAVMGRRLELVYAEVATGAGERRSTRRLPHPSGPSSVHSPESIAAQ